MLHSKVTVEGRDFQHRSTSVRLCEAGGQLQRDALRWSWRSRDTGDQGLAVGRCQCVLVHSASRHHHTQLADRSTCRQCAPHASSARLPALVVVDRRQQPATARCGRQVVAGSDVGGARYRRRASTFQRCEQVWAGTGRSHDRAVVRCFLYIPCCDPAALCCVDRYRVHPKVTGSGSGHRRRPGTLPGKDLWISAAGSSCHRSADVRQPRGQFLPVLCDRAEVSTAAVCRAVLHHASASTCDIVTDEGPRRGDRFYRTASTSSWTLWPRWKRRQFVTPVIRA